MADVTKTLKDVLYVTVGLGVITVREAKERRQALRRQVETQLSDTGEQLQKALRYGQENHLDLRQSILELNLISPERLNEQLFYAHLYIGLYFETEGNKKKALEHIAIAAGDHPIGHYMWDVARVHRDLLRKERKK